MDWDLTTTKSKEGLSSFMKNAEESLQKISGMDLVAYDNAKQALDIFKPLTDINGEYGYIVGDHAVTTKFKQNESMIEKSKTDNKGEQYNPAYETILTAQKALFAKENNPDSWKNYYYNMEEYKPGVDLTKRLLDLEKGYREQIGEGTTTEEFTGDGRKIITKDQSINADKYQEYLNTHLTNQEKEQLLLNKKAEYWSNLISYSAVSDPAKKAEIYAKLKTNYSAVSNQQIDEEVDHVKKVKSAYEKYKAQTPAENTDMLKQLNDGIADADRRLGQLEGKRLTDKQIDMMIDPSNWTTGQNLYVNTFADNELSRIAKSAAVSKISKTTEKDDAYWEQMKLNLDMYKAGLQYGDGKFSQDSGTLEQEKLMTEDSYNSPEKFGQYLYDRDAKDIATQGSSLKIIDVVTNEDISERYDRIKDQLNNMTLAEAMENGYISQDNKRLNTLLSQVELSDGKGGKRKVNPEVDNANVVLAGLKTLLSQKSNIDYLITVNQKNPELRKGLNQAVTELELANSKASSLNKNFQKVFKTVVSQYEAPDGAKFTDELSRYKINNPDDLRKALQDFSDRHKGVRMPWSGYDKEYERIMKKEGPEGANSFWGNPTFAKFNAAMNTVGSNTYGYTPAGWITGALGWTHPSYTTGLDVDDAMNKFYAEYGKNQGDTAFLGYAFHKTRPISKEEGVVKAFESKVSTYALNATERPELNKLIKDYTNMVSDVYEGKQGYGVQFSTNISESEGKTFLEAYKAMAENDPSGVFKDAGTVQEAISNLNNYFKNVRIPTKAINSQDKKYNIDQNLKFASDNRQLTSVNVDSEDLSSLYGLKNQDDVVVGIKNKRAAQLGFDDMDLGMNIHYLRPLIKNGMIQRDSSGNVQLEHIYGKDILDLEVKKLVATGKYTTSSAIEEAKRKIMTNVTEFVTRYGTEARNYLDFIRYLNTDARNISSLKSIPGDVLNDYISQ